VILFYRKHKNSMDDDWHFHTQCSRWPETDFVQTRVLEPGEGERLCRECVKREAEMFPPKE
jgi:hypothetical protein